MSFRVSARTILQLGAELVSSDAVSFYELIKNAFDAKSPDVRIDVDIALPWDDYITFADYIHHMIQTSNQSGDTYKDDLNSIKDETLSKLDHKATTSSVATDRISAATSWLELLHALEATNRIAIKDTGEGMTLEDLADCFLTIGTRSRQRLRGSSEDRPVLGEKGLGRLSAMRLGNQLCVCSSTAGEMNCNILEIDWRVFSHDSDDLLENIDIAPAVGPVKTDPNSCGTEVVITALTDSWTTSKVKAIAEEQFSKLTDPFSRELRYPVKLFFNGERVSIPSFDRILFDAAHASGRATFSVNEDCPRFAGETHYILRDRKRSFSVEGEHLVSAARAPSISILRNLGPFTVEFYWFNRRILTELDGIGTRKQVLELQSRWAGGLMVFRDGFRVHPYGDPDDDWIDLDSKALSSQAYKVNRRQIVGRVCIGARTNPALLDQTSREGLRDCPEKHVLVNLLKHFLETHFREFLKQCDKEVQAAEPIDVKDIQKRVTTEVKRMRQSLRTLKEKYPEAAQGSGIVKSIESSVEHLKTLMSAAENEVQAYKKGRSEMVHLAGMGLMVEVVVHELTRATEHALRAVASAFLSDLPKNAAGLFATFESQLKTLQKRLSVLDPASTSRRQVKEEFDLSELTRSVLAGHSAQFDRHRICCEVVVTPEESQEWIIKMVKGMLIHVLENLISNSVYWFKQKANLDRTFSPRLRIDLNQKQKVILFSDNGPGISEENTQKVFEAFYTTKPPGEGKGLGLFISREIAKYHGAELSICENPPATALDGAVFMLAFERA